MKLQQTILSLGLSATIKERMEKMLKKINSLKEFYKIFFIFSLSLRSGWAKRPTVRSFANDPLQRLTVGA